MAGLPRSSAAPRRPPTGGDASTSTARVVRGTSRSGDVAAPARGRRARHDVADEAAEPVAPAALTVERLPHAAQLDVETLELGAQRVAAGRGLDPATSGGTADG